MITDWYQKTITWYEKTFGTWPKIKLGFIKIAKALDELDKRNLLDEGNNWQNERESLKEYKTIDYLIPFKKIINNLYIVQSQLKSITEKYDLEKQEERMISYGENIEEKVSHSIKTEIKMPLEDQKKIIVAMEEQLGELIYKIEEVTDSNIHLHEEYKHLELQYNMGVIECENAYNQFKDLVLKLIVLRDQLLLFKVNQSGEIVTLLNNLYDEVGSILVKSNVKIYDTIGGKFNPEIHTVIKTIPTNIDEKIDIIAESIRPGYIINNNCLRSQEVAVFIKI